MRTVGYRRISIAAVVTVALGVQATALVSIDSSSRTVTTPNLFVDWSDERPDNPEEISALKWSSAPSPGGPGGTTLTDPSFTSGCIPFEEHFGNSWAGGSPQTGDAVLVGAGSTGSWSTAPGRRVVINSKSTLNNCPPNAFNAANVPVATEYQFWNNAGLRSAAGPWQRMRVTREFDFSVPFTPDFRPYIPRLFVDEFSEVVYPTTTGVIAVSVLAFPLGGIATPTWDAAAGWFAMHSTTTGRGLLIKRVSATPAQLWLDWDSGDTGTNSNNASSILLLAPPGGFTGSVTEEEFLCFYDASTWDETARQAGILPQACGG